jgi:hypothetical protein
MNVSAHFIIRLLASTIVTDRHFEMAAVLPFPLDLWRFNAPAALKFQNKH